MRSCDLLPLAMLLAGCPETDDTGDTHDEVESYACVVGALDADGAFVPYATSGQAELVLGFQGFLFLEARILADDAPALVRVTASLAVGDDTPSGVTQPDVPFEATAAGDLSGEVLLFLPNAEVASFVGQPAAISLRAEDDERSCVTTADVTLVDLDPCIHTDDEPICPGDDTGGTR